MTLDDLQESVDKWIQTHGSGSYWGKFEILARLTEELGELACTLQHTEGLRTARVDLKLSDEIGDLMFTLAAFANTNDLRMTDCINGVLEKYQTRDSPEW